MTSCHSLTGELFYKEGGIWSRFKSKRKYWYLLDEARCQLMCYRSQNDAAKCEAPLNEFDIKSSAIKLSLYEANQFIITNAGKNHIFTAENHESMMVWVLTLQALRNSHIAKETKTLEETGINGQIDTPGDKTYLHDATMKQAVLEITQNSQHTREIQDAGIAQEKSCVGTSGNNQESEKSSTKGEPSIRKDMETSLQNDASDEVFEENSIKAYGLKWRKLSRNGALTDESSTPSPSNALQRSFSGQSASSDSAFDRSIEGDLSAKVNDMEEELMSVKCELADMKNREGCYKAVLEKKDVIIAQLDEKLDFHQNFQFDSKGAQKKLREQIRSLQNKNHFLNEEVSKLSDLRNKDKIAWDIAQRKCEGLELTLTTWRQDYLYLLQTSITVPTGDLTDGYEVNLFGGNRHRDRLKSLLEEARATNPSLPTFEKLAYSDVHIDSYGFRHRYNNEGMVLHYIAHQLHSVYKMQLASYKQHHQQWAETIKKIKATEVVPNDLKYLVRNGIPPSCRKDMWKHLVYLHVDGIRKEKGPCYYSNLCRNVRDSEVAGRYRKQIFLDLLRTMPTNVNFSSASAKGTQKLQEVLLAFCLHNSSVGYCQGMNFIAAMALLFMDAEDAFWTLVAVTEKYFSPSYFDAHLTGAQADQSVLKDIMKDQLPPLLQHLEELEIDISTVTLNWFLALYFDAVPFETLLRIWDCFLLEGPKVLFRVALAILKINSENIMKKTDTFSTMRHLKSCPGLMYDADGLMKVAFEDLKKFPRRLEIQNKRATHMEALKERLKKRTEQRRIFDDKNQLFRNLNDTADPVQKQAFECATTCHQGLVWLCYGDQQIGKISLIDCDEVLMCNTDLQLDSRIICTCAVGQFILLGLLSGYLVLYHTKLRGEVWQMAVHDSVFSLCYHSEEGHSKKVFAGLANGTLAILMNVCDAEPSEDPLYIHVGHGPVTSLCIINNQLLCASGSVIHIVHVDTLDVMDRLMVSSNPFDHILSLASGIAGLWVAIQGSSVVELWDPKLLTCKLLFDVRENRQVAVKKDEDGSLSAQRVTAILPVDDSLWVGTGEGAIFIYDLVGTLPDESARVSKYLYGKAPHPNRNRVHRNPEKMTACMKLRQAKLYSSSETDLRDFSRKLHNRAEEQVPAEPQNSYSAKVLRHKITPGRVDIKEKSPADVVASRMVKHPAVERSVSQQKDSETRRKDFRTARTNSLRKSKIPRSPSFEVESNLSDAPKRAHHSPEVADDEGKEVPQRITLKKKEMNSVRNERIESILRSSNMTQSAEGTLSLCNGSQTDPESKENHPSIPKEETSTSLDDAPVDNSAIEDDSSISGPKADVKESKMHEVQNKESLTRLQKNDKSVINNKGKDYYDGLSRQGQAAIKALHGQVHKSQPEMMLPLIMTMTQGKKALPPVESRAKVKPTLLTNGERPHKSLSIELKNATNSKDYNERKAGSFEMIDGPYPFIGQKEMTNIKLQNGNALQNGRTYNQVSTETEEKSNDVVVESQLSKMEISAKTATENCGIKSGIHTPGLDKKHNNGKDENPTKKTGNLQYVLRLEAKIKISDKPIRCLHKTRDKDMRTVIISCSGCYGDDESILKWRKVPNEKIWTNEPVYEICPETNRPKFPSYLQKSNWKSSSESLQNSPYFSKKSRSYSSPTN